MNSDMSEPQPPAMLDEKGRCCGRKPLVYKRPDHFLFCDRCCRAYSPTGAQRPNWAWRREGDGFAPTHPNGDYVKGAR